ncbi:MAG: type II secretion system F family protein [Kiritimatiellae bacterium]|nr:type II secretion system F family protein [Kiritimatiellia bacterium]
MAVFKSTLQPPAKQGATRPAMPRAAEQRPAQLKTSHEPSAREQKTAGAAEKVFGANKIKAKELPPFSRQLSAMLLAGMPLIQALDALEDQTSDKHFRTVILGLKNYLQAGASFSEALQHYPAVFDQLYVNMIKAGESGGQLGETAGRLAGFLENSARLTRKVKSAMTYPVVVLFIAVSIAIAMILFIVPVFAGMFADFGAKLPGPTQFMVDLSGALRKYGIFIVALIAIAIIVFKKWKQTATGAYQLSAFFLRFPIIGELNRKVATSRFARTFAQLLKSGVPILQAMEIVSRATGNKVFETVIMEARSTVERGEPLSGALIKYHCFPKLLVHMLSAGEKTGKIDEMMQNIAGFYDDEVEVMLDGMTSLIEPLLMIFLGVTIGSIVISMFLPIFKMGEIVGAGG